MLAFSHVDSFLRGWPARCQPRCPEEVAAVWRRPPAGQPGSTVSRPAAGVHGVSRCRIYHIWRAPLLPRDRGHANGALRSGLLSPDEALRARALRVIPGGMWGHVNVARRPPGYPQFFRGARGCRLFDVAGTEGIDMMCGYGPRRCRPIQRRPQPMPGRGSNWRISFSSGPA